MRSIRAKMAEQSEFSFTYGSTFRTELQQSQRKAIKHAKRSVKQWEQLTELTDKREYSETKTRRGELQRRKMSRQTLVHETVHNLLKSQSSEAKDNVYRNESVCTWAMRTRRSTAPTRRVSQHEKKWPVQEGLSALEENWDKTTILLTFHSSSFSQGTTNFPGTF